jgi:hypothetical protein
VSHIMPLVEFGNGGNNGVNTPTPSEQVYVPLLEAFNHFNRELFAGALPDCVITLQRKTGTFGYFSRNKFVAIGGDARVHEIALNPARFLTSTPKDICDTLVHEMCHLWQAHAGKAPRSGYHDRQWAAKMREIGLQPSATGTPGGKTTGYRMSDYVVEGGPFDKAFEAFEATGAAVAWADAFVPNKEASKPKRETFICPDCGQKVLGVPKTKVRCDLCNLPMIARHKDEAPSDSDDDGAQEVP